MSFDLTVWRAIDRLTNSQAKSIYRDLCESKFDGLKPHRSLGAFYKDLTKRYPEITTVPDDRIDDTEFCPWSCALDRSASHVHMSCVWSQAENVERVVHELATKHNLVVYDPQQERVVQPKKLGERYVLAIWKRSATTKTAMLDEAYCAICKGADHPAMGKFKLPPLESALKSALAEFLDSGSVEVLPSSEKTSWLIIRCEKSDASTICEKVIPIALRKGLMVYDPQRGCVWGNQRPPKQPSNHTKKPR